MLHFFQGGIPEHEVRSFGVGFLESLFFFQGGITEHEVRVCGLASNVLAKDLSTKHQRTLHQRYSNTDSTGVHLDPSNHKKEQQHPHLQVEAAIDAALLTASEMRLNTDSTGIHLDPSTQNEQLQHPHLQVHQPEVETFTGYAHKTPEHTSSEEFTQMD